MIRIQPLTLLLAHDEWHPRSLQAHPHPHRHSQATARIVSLVPTTTSLA
jgi:hypothetical protein